MASICSAPASRARSADLRGVEIVGGRQARDELQVFGGGERVGRVQTEIADEKRVRLFAKSVQDSGGAHQNRAVEAEQKIQDARFTGLENARAGYAYL